MTTACPTGHNTTADLIEDAAQRYAAKTFIHDSGRDLSFETVFMQVQHLANTLVARDFRSGDRAAIWAPNCAEWIIAALAIQYVGGTLVTVNTRYKAGEARDIIADSGSSVAFVVDEFLGSNYAQELENENIVGLEHIVALPAPNSLNETTYHRWIHEGERAPDNHSAQRDTQRLATGPNTVSDILFTSGTTGRAKGVVTTHGQNIHAFDVFSDILGLDETDHYLIINPFFHSFGYKAGWLAALLRGATVYPMAVFDVPAVLKAISTHQISVMPGPPTLFQSILMHSDRDAFDISSLKKATTGAATIPTQLIVAMRETLGIDTVITAYGLSETCGLVTMCRRGDAPDIIAKTSGRAIPEVEVGIMRHDGTLAPPDETGEIVVRGFNVMQCYFNNEQATSETIDKHGWLHTGDIGSLDCAGNICITDRLKDMFISGGFNCYPAEIENQLLNHDEVAQAAVVGMPDERMGEVSAAFVVRTPKSQLLEADLIDWSRQNMANYKVPRRIIFTETLPLNASGKVLKTELRAML
jgi:acyl-CoA synthetase (AMP-forming)/AMP-acid ligase II